MYNLPKEWKYKKFHELFDRITERNNRKNDNVLTISAQDGLVAQNQFFNKIVASENKSNYYFIQKGDFAYNKSYSKGYPFGAFKRLKNYDQGIVSPLYICFRGKSNIITDFYEQYFESGYFNREINSIAQEGARNHGLLNMSLSDFYNTKLIYPTILEQKKIADILSTWDEAIDLQNKLILQKKNLLSSLALSLVKNHKSLVNFQSSWRKVSLNEVFFERKEYGYEDENIELYSLTIENGVTAKTDRYNREFLVKSDKKKYKVAKYRDLVFNPQNLRYGAIALNYNENPVLLSPIYATLELRDNDKYDLEYFNFLLTSKEMIKFYDSIAEGTLIERMTVKPEIFLNQEFSIPPVDEQRKISQILMEMRNEISLLENDIILKKSQKKGLMQQLITGRIRVILK
jgi:type I restriction enzyme S subunit